MVSLASTILAPSVPLTPSSLEAAMRGYTYQDAVVCYLMLKTVAAQEGVLTANQLIHKTDKFDDVALANSEGHTRRQIKHSADATKQFQLEDLTTRRNRARIDDLIRSHRDAGASQASQYRFCATWLNPTDASVLGFLENANVSSSFEGHATSTFRFNVEEIWPLGEESRWKPLKDAPDITREDFVEFASLFILELKCPAISNDFSKPGALEMLILEVLRDRIGIGRYPNQERTPIDVAASMMWLAQKCRVEDGQVTVDSLETFLRLRRDFGRVAQRFPLEEKEFVRRSQFQDHLHQKIESADGELILLTGLPGAGKSWLQESLSRELREAGHLVARHYCYLEPGDVEVQKRITTNAMWGNVIVELIENAPTLRAQHQPIYAADAAAFEQLLPHAVTSSSTRQVIIFVDGLDHIARVLSEERDLSQSDVDIIEQLKALRVPEGVTLILGSQPGQHLDPIRDRTQEIVVPDWSLSDVEELALRRELKTVLSRSGHLVPRRWEQPDEAADIAWNEIVGELHERCEGNPLYATFLCAELLQLGAEKSAVFWHEKLNELPAFSGRISNYYDFLLHALEKEDASAVFAAELLGVVDFGLKSDELREIFPLLGHRLEGWLKRLRPILKQTSSQGGIRIYHESFRRFVLERIQGGSQTLPQLLQPLIDWLRKRPFYFDAKAYRFLLPNLRRAGYGAQVLEYLETEFVAHSIAAGQPRQAINSSIALGLAVATELGDWAAMCRLIHLRYASMVFEGKLEMLEYGRTLAQVHGADILSERLLFDGRPTMIRQEGLILCSIGDREGKSVPWAEYLGLSDTTTEGSYQSHFSDLESSAQFQGELRVFGWDVCKQGLCNWLGQFGRDRQQTKAPNGAPARRSIHDDYPLGRARGYITTVREVIGVEALEELIGMQADAGAYSQEIVALIQVEVARAYLSAARFTEARQAADLALTYSPPLELVVECASLSCDATLLSAFEPTLQQLTDLAQSLNSERHPNTFLVDSWVWINELLSWTNPTLLETTKALPQGIGWYRQWLRFVPQLMQAENLRRQEDQVGADSNSAPLPSEQLISASLENLAHDIKPFEGNPRACDLYQIHSVITGILGRATALIRHPDVLDQTLSFLRTISYETTTWLDRSGNGPFAPIRLFESLLNLANEPQLKESALRFLLGLADDWQQHSQYYETHAENEFWRVRALLATERVEEASTAWEKSAQFLSAYGFRKDISLYEILDPLTLLADLDGERAKSLCCRVQRLPDAVVKHTDGRSTNRLPISWLEALLRVDFVGAVHVMAQTLRQDDDQTGWMLNEALGSVLDEARKRDDCDPLIVTFLDATRPFPALSREYGDDVKREAQSRLETLSCLMEKGRGSQVHNEWGERATENFLAQAEGDGPSRPLEALELVREFAAQWNIILPPENEFEEVEVSEAQASENSQPSPPAHQSSLEGTKKPVWEPVFPPNATPADLVSIFRSFHSYNSKEESGHWDNFVNAFGYRLLALAEDDGEGEGEGEVLRLLRHFARENLFYHGATPLGHLGEGFLRYGKIWLAAVAFALAYASSRSEGGYQFLGGNEFESWLLQARDLNSPVAFEVLFNEVAFYANKEYLNGMAQNLIKFCARHQNPNLAFDAWEEVCRVLETRLPDIGSGYRTFAVYEPQQVPKWTPDEALSFLLLVRLGHPEYKRRQAACVGVCAVLQTAPLTLKIPIKELLKSDINGTTAIHCLQILWNSEIEPYPITEFLYDELSALRQCKHFALRATANLLLERFTQVKSHLPFLSDHVDHVPTLDPRLENKIAALDWGNRANTIKRVWPDFPSLVIQHFESIWQGQSHASKRHQIRDGELMKSAKSRVHPHAPTTRCFWWHQEIYEASFQELLDNIDNHLVRQGLWAPESTLGLLQRVTSSIRLHTSLWNSRIPRPFLPLPRKLYAVSSQEVELLATPNAVQENSVFNGWIRLAAIEEELGSDVTSYSEQYLSSSIRTLQGALISRGPSDLPSANGYPFIQGDPQDWFIGSDDAIAQHGHLHPSRCGGIVGLDEIQDTLGESWILSLSPQIAAWLGLSPGNWPKRLHLVDDSGDIGIVFRHWSVRSIGSGMDEQCPRFIGCELLMRPDLWDRLQSYLQNPVIFWSTTYIS